MNKYTFILLIITILISACNQETGKKQPASNPEMPYRSVSFHIEPDSNTILRAAELGFNDICIQTEGDTEERLKQLRKAEENYGYMQLAKSKGMTVSVWIREISNYDKSWGEVSVENEVLWQKMKEKYDYFMTELIPEADNFVLTVVESQVNIADNTPVFQKVLEVILDRCKEHDKNLILRTFVHYPHEYDTLIANLSKIPDEVSIQTKYVPSDWNMRGPDNFLIGKVGNKNQYIEMDICGEYWRNTYLPNCWTENLHNRYQHWIENSCDGISVRVDRSPRKGAWWEPLHYYHKIYAHPQEVNLWLLGQLSTGKTNDPDDAWQDWANEYFNEDIADEIIEIFKPQGKIVAEAIHVETEPFGATRNKIPAEWTMNGQHCKCGDTLAVKYSNEEDMLYRNPFYHKYSPNVWNAELKPRYHMIRRGHEDVIAKKQSAYNEMVKTSINTINRFRQLKDKMNEKKYRFYLFKLEENLFHLQVMCEAEIAWLKASNNLYFRERNNEILQMEVESHLEHLESLHHKTNEELVIDWQGRHYEIKRGEYLDIPGFIELFNKYWQIEK